jgi:hypothetical protein
MTRYVSSERIDMSEHQTTFVMSDGNPESPFGDWCVIYVGGEKVHEGHWPIPFPVLRRILEADVVQVTIDPEKFAPKGYFENEGFPEEFENIYNHAGVEVVASQPYAVIKEADARKAAAAIKRIEENKGH